MKHTKLLFAALLIGVGACGEAVAPPTISAPTNPAPSSANPAVTYVQTGTGFFYPTGKTDPGQSCGTWLRRGPPYDCYAYYNNYHIGWDFMSPQYSPVYAISRGTVIHKDVASSWESNNVALVIRHLLSDGSEFLALYGHIKTDLQEGDRVSGGVEIGTIGYSSGGFHVHLGVVPGSAMPSKPWGSLNMNTYTYPDPHGFVDPLNWIRTRTPKCENGTAEKYRPGGLLPRHPNGSLIQVHGDPTVYVLQNGQRRAIPSAARLWELYGPGRGFDFRDVITVSSGERDQYPRGADVTAALPYNGRSEPDGRLIRQSGGSEISIVTNNGKRRPFTSAKAFLALGYTFCNVANVSDYYSYPVGTVISQ